MAFDVTDEDQVRAGIASVVDEVGPVQVLVNNAGIQRRAPLVEMALSDWQAVIDTNLTSLFNVTGQPAISVPVHHDDATGLPVGVQLVAAPWRENLLLQLARLLEVAHPWAHRRAVVS